MKQIAYTIVAILMISIISSFASAIAVDSVQADKFSPGDQGSVHISIENILNEDAQDVSLSLELSGTPFISIGSSEESVDRINEGDDEQFSFRLKSAADATPGDYDIPYTITYKKGSSDTVQTKKGSIGLTISAQPELSFSATIDTPVVGRNAQMTVRIVNNGLADAKFVSVNLVPSGYTLLSSKEVYVGTVSSDDFETISVDVIFTGERPRLNAIVNYRDFENSKQQTEVDLPLQVYSEQKALELGIIQRNNTMYYIIAIVVLIVLWFVWRTIRKRRRMRSSMNRS